MRTPLLALFLATVLEYCYGYDEAPWQPVIYDYYHIDLSELSGHPVTTRPGGLAIKIPTPKDTIVDSINNLGLKLMAIHNEHNENNIAISPYGAFSVLAALSEGLKGDSAYEILQAAQIPKDKQVIRVGLRDVHRHLKSYFIPHEGFLAGLTLNLNNVTLRKEYEDVLRFYGFDYGNFNNALYPDPPTTGRPTEGTTLETGLGVPDDTTVATTPTVERTTAPVLNRGAEVPATTEAPATTITTNAAATTTVAPIVTTTAPPPVTTTTPPPTTTTAAPPPITSTAPPTTISPTTTPTATTTVPTTTTTIPVAVETTTAAPESDATVQETSIVTTQASPASSGGTGRTTREIGTTLLSDETARTTEYASTERRIDNAVGMTVTQETLVSTQGEQETTTRTTTEAVDTTTENVSPVTTGNGQEVTIVPVTATPTILDDVSETSVSQEAEVNVASTATAFLPDATESSLFPNLIPATEITSAPSTVTETNTPFFFGSTSPFQDVTSSITQDTTSDFDFNYNYEANSVPPVYDEPSTQNPTTPALNATFRRSVRSVVDYVLARLYEDDHHDDFEIPPPIPYVPQEHITFMVHGKYPEPGINFMKYDTVLPYFFVHNLKAQALSFPLDSTKYYLLLLLPLRTNGIDQLICDLRLYGNFRYIIQNLRKTHVVATIPSFTLKGYVTLTPTLQRLGVRRIFEPRQADFSPMTNVTDIYVTNIEQAVTVTIRNYLDPSAERYKDFRQFEPVEFKANHPFLYFVVDSELNVALMVGKVINPLNTRIS